MRHRPGLCVSGRRREARPPLLTGRFSSASIAASQSNKRPETPHMGGISWTWWTVLSHALRPRGCRGPTPRPRRGRTRARALSQHHDAGHDRRRPVGVQARHLAPLLERDRGELVEHGAQALGRTAGDPRRRAPRRPGRCPRTASAVPATATAAVTRSRSRRGTACGDRALHVGGERRELLGRRRVGVQVALGVAHDADLGGHVEGDLAALADHELGRAAADVDHQQPARRRARRARSSRRGRSGAPPRRRRGCGRRSRSASRTASRERRAVGRVAHRRGQDRGGALGAVLARSPRAYSLEHVEHALPRRLAERAAWRRRPRRAG